MKSPNPKAFQESLARFRSRLQAGVQERDVGWGIIQRNRHVNIIVEIYIYTYIYIYVYIYILYDI